MLIRFALTLLRRYREYGLFPRQQHDGIRKLIAQEPDAIGKQFVKKAVGICGYDPVVS